MLTRRFASISPSGEPPDKVWEGIMRIYLATLFIFAASLPRASGKFKPGARKGCHACTSRKTITALGHLKK
jgi:hypothetical protein